MILKMNGWAGNIDNVLGIINKYHSTNIVEYKINFFRYHITFNVSDDNEYKQLMFDFAKYFGRNK